MYSCLVGDSGEHKKVKNLNKNIVATISHGEYKDVLLNNKYLRHSINRIQSKKRKQEPTKSIKSFCHAAKM